MRFARLFSTVVLMLMPVSLRAAEPETIKNSLRMTLVVIPAGEFQMGEKEEGVAIMKAYPYAGPDFRKSDDAPQHRVRITKPFYMSIYETRLRELIG